MSYNFKIMHQKFQIIFVSYLFISSSYAEKESWNLHEKIVQFSTNLNRGLVHHFKNHNHIFFSPLSIYSILTIVASGSVGETQHEILSVLDVPSDIDYTVLHQHFHHLVDHLEHDDVHSNLSLHYGLFLQDGFFIKDTFLKWVETYYNIEVINLDFSKQSSLDFLNGWFNSVTQGKIHHFFNEVFPSDTKLLLGNAMCFSGKWEHEFPHEMTKTELFHGITENKEIKVMQKTEYVPYYKDEQHNYEVIGIPFKGSEYFMYLILPEKSETLHVIGDVFSYHHILHVIETSTNTTTDIKLPVTKWNLGYNLQDVIKDMGIVKLFESPDLRNMVNSPLVVSQVSHYISIDVNEIGADICSGSTIQYTLTSKYIAHNNAQQFYVLKPFAFFIWHSNSSTMLYYGTIFNISD